MRVLLSTYGTRGDVEPLVALAVRLAELGVEVRMCAPPDEEFRRRLSAFGIPMVPAGPPMRELMSGKTPPSAAKLSRYRNEVVEAQFRVFPEAAAGCDVLVAAGLAQVAARSVAEAAGIRYVYVSYSAVNLPSPHHAPPPRSGWPEPAVTHNQELWERDARDVNAQFAEALNAHRAALGLSFVDNVRDHVYSDRPWLAADPVLGPWQEIPGLDVVQTGAWTLPDERRLPAGLAAFLDAGTPPVYVGFGSSSPLAGVVHQTVETARAHGRRVLVSSGWADLAPVDGKSDLFAIGDVNHQRLFERVAAVVHHGGAGTTLTAARAGAPQLVIPLPVADPPYWAGRVAELEIGAAVHDPTAESLSAAFETALSPGTLARAKALSSKVHTDGATAAAARLVAELG